MFLLLPLFFFFVFPSSALAEETYHPENGVLISQASFFPPFGTEIPFWQLGGSAEVSGNKIRLTSNLQSQRGWIWTNKPIRFRDWETIVQISVGSNTKVGADGMGIWFTKDRAKPGPIVGNSDQWDGVGVIVDTFDNDGQKDNPQIYALYNDNTNSANPAMDGKDLSRGMCRVNIRQISPQPESKLSQILIRYKENVFTVLYDISVLLGGGHSWVECFSTPLKLDDMLNGYFMGLTAETGGLTDFHDVVSVTTWSLPSIQDKEEKRFVDPGGAKDPKKTREFVEPDIRVAGTPRPRRPGLDPNAEILNRVVDLDKKEELFTNNIGSKFGSMINKLQTIETDKFRTLSSIESTLSTLSQTLDSQKLQDIKNNLKSALVSLGDVQSRISIIEAHVEGTYQKAIELNSLHSVRSVELLQMVEQKGTWGFWTYFMVIQIFVWLLFVWWRGRKEEKIRW